jgi:hypothetical protein
MNNVPFFNALIAILESFSAYFDGTFLIITIPDALSFIVNMALL